MYETAGHKTSRTPGRSPAILGRASQPGPVLSCLSMRFPGLSDLLRPPVRQKKQAQMHEVLCGTVRCAGMPMREYPGNFSPWGLALPHLGQVGLPSAASSPVRHRATPDCYSMLHFRGLLRWPLCKNAPASDSKVLPFRLPGGADFYRPQPNQTNYGATTYSHVVF